MAESSVNTAQKLIDILRAFLAPDAAAAAQTIVNGGFRVRLTAGQPKDSNIYLAGANVQSAPNTIAGNVFYTHTLDASTSIQMKVDAFRITAGEAVTSANTDLATWALVYNNGNGGSDTTIATANTTAAGGGVALTANTPLAITLTDANRVVPSGSCVQIKVTKAGTNGKQLPAVSYQVEASFQGATG